MMVAREMVANAKLACCRPTDRPKLGVHGWMRALGRVPGGFKVGTEGLSAEMLRATPWPAKCRLAMLLDDGRVDTYPCEWTAVELVTIAK